MTDVHIYDSSLIPSPPADAAKARRPSNRSKINRQPNRIENEFVSILYSSINKERIPADDNFEEKKNQSINVKQKFSELKDARAGMFIDSVAQIVREPYDLGDKFTLWVSDYTENPSFHHYGFMGMSAGKGGDSTHSSSSQKSEWAGPFGKQSLQITCYEPHASILREQRFSVNTWIHLRNLQIKFGKNETNLEGYLREDQGAQGIKINISQLDHQNRETMTEELKNALRRKRAYESEKKGQLKELTAAANAGQKRKAHLGLESEPPATNASNASNSKQRRKKSRHHKQEAFERQREQGDENPPSKTEDTDDAPDDLNGQGKPSWPFNHTIEVTDNRPVKCENEGKPSTTVAEMLAPKYVESVIDGSSIKLQLPFVNAKYRTYARVTDFMPSRLEDFAHPRTSDSEYGALSDHEEESEPDSENESRAIVGWEWRFYLRLEGASTKETTKKSTWVIVNNQAAQMLLNLDASDLRKDDGKLAAVRQKMWSLWGELEDHKAKMENRALKARHSNNANAPPEHSDDEEEVTKKKTEQVRNRPFACCIHQYGAKVAEGDETKADAGDGKRWERMFGLFGTKIANR